jgi:hypothetical protein
MDSTLPAACVVMMLTLTVCPAIASNQTENGYIAYTGAAAAPHSMKYLYGERHVLSYRDGRLAERVVLYTCGNGAPFARKTARYMPGNAFRPATPFAPDFLLEDAATGLRQGVRSLDDGRSVFFRGERAGAEKSRPLPQDPELVADAGFDEFIRAHWRGLVEGKGLVLHFLVPSRLEALAFEVRHIRSGDIDGLPTEVFRLKLAGALGWLMSPIEVSYDAGEHVLLHYDGLSDLRDAAGNNFPVQIIFRAGDRVPSDAAAMSMARQAPLTPCI